MLEEQIPLFMISPQGKIEGSQKLYSGGLTTRVHKKFKDTASKLITDFGWMVLLIQPKMSNVFYQIVFLGQFCVFTLYNITQHLSGPFTLNVTNHLSVLP